VVTMTEIGAKVVSLFTGGTSGGKATLPGGLTVDKWIAQVEQERGADYSALVADIVAHLRGHGRADTVAQLRRVFPKTYDRMVPVVLPVLPKLVGELAHVYGGDGEKFEVLGEPTIAEDGSIVETVIPGFAEVVDRAALVPKLKEVNRLTTAIRRTYVRVTWDDKLGRIVLTIFTPDAVFPHFAADSYDLDQAAGVLLRVADAHIDGKPVKRWEWWSAGDKARGIPPDNFVIDEKGNVTRPADGVGNPFKDDAGNPVVPLVSFGDADTDAGYWLKPREDWLEQQRSVNVDTTSARHIARVTGFGVWTAQAASVNGAEDWPGENTLSPDEILPVPKGWTLENVAAQADLKGLDESAQSFIRTITSLNNLPPGSVLSEGRQVPSGVALQIERAPLDETRATQVDNYRESTTRLLDLIRYVWNDGHAASEQFRGTSRWTPGAVKPPEDPEARNRIDKQQIDMGIDSPVTVHMRRAKVSREEAEKHVEQCEADNRERMALSGLGARLMSGGPLPARPPPGPLAQARGATPEEPDDEDESANE
jgi:hypothetical protein